MTDKKITELTELTAVDDADVLVIVDDVSGTATTKKITKTNLLSGKTNSSSGAGVPSSTPTAAGDIYVDTTALKIYIATGISSSADWKKVISQ